MSRFLLFACILAFLPPFPLAAQVTVTVYPTVGPNSTNASAAGFGNNSVNSLFQTLPGASGNIVTPSSDPAAAYMTTGNSTQTNNLISTPFNSWKGVANPSNPYSSQTGNNLYFGATLVSENPGNVQFALDNIVFAVNSSSAELTIPSTPISANYSASEVGIIANPITGSLTSGETILDAGQPGDTLVDAVLLTGVSTGYNSLNFTNQSGSDQQILNNGLSEIGAGPITVTGTYTITPTFPNGGTTGSGSGTVQASYSNPAVLPEPATIVIAVVGLAGLLVYVRFRTRCAAAG